MTESTEPETKAPEHRLGAVFYDQFELLDAYGPLEMFGSLGGRVAITSVSGRAGPVASAQGPAALADCAYGDAPDFDLILVPGGIGTFMVLEDPALLDFLRRQAAGATCVMSVCTGSALLAKAGLLDGRRATSNKLYFDLVRRVSDAVDWVTEARWVEDGTFATSSGVSAGMDMALAVIERLYGPEEAERLAVYTEYSRHRDAASDPFAAWLNKGIES